MFDSTPSDSLGSSSCSSGDGVIASEVIAT
jgi:hypothetical protein